MKDRYLVLEFSLFLNIIMVSMLPCAITVISGCGEETDEKQQAKFLGEKSWAGTLMGETSTQGETNSQTVTAEAAPRPPSNLQIFYIGGGLVLMWSDNSDNEDEFNVKLGDGATFSKIATLPTNSEIFKSVPDGLLKPGVQYYFKVNARNAKGGSGPSNVVPFTLPAETTGASANHTCARVGTHFADVATGCQDKRTGRIWLNPRQSLNQAGAIRYCLRLSYLGVNDWRLPTSGELMRLFANGGATHVSMPSRELGKNYLLFWSSSAYNSTFGTRVEVRLEPQWINNPDARPDYRTKIHHVLCVR